MTTIGKNTLSIVSILIVTLSLTCKKDLKSSDKEILKFTVPGQVDSTIIDSKTATITLTLGANADLTKIIPSIIISKNAKIFPKGLNF